MVLSVFNLGFFFLFTLNNILIKTSGDLIQCKICCLVMNKVLSVGVLVCIGLAYATALPLTTPDVDQPEHVAVEKDLEAQETRGWGGGWGNYGGGGDWGHHGGGGDWGHHGGGGGWGHHGGGGNWGYGGGSGWGGGGWGGGYQYGGGWRR